MSTFDICLYDKQYIKNAPVKFYACNWYLIPRYNDTDTINFHNGKSLSTISDYYHFIVYDDAALLADTIIVASTGMQDSDGITYINGIYYYITIESHKP
jgi:hypothetical protein